MPRLFLLFASLALLLLAHGKRPSGPNFCKGYKANPSVFNFALGDRPAKVISDGRLIFEVGDTYAEPPHIVQRALKLNFQSFSPIIFENNIVYLDLGGRKILFDTGNSYLRPETAGFLFKKSQRGGHQSLVNY